MIIYCTCFLLAIVVCTECASFPNQYFGTLIPCEENNDLPVSICVQLPPKTPLNLPKDVLQQIVYALTNGENDELPVQPATSGVPVKVETKPCHLQAASTTVAPSTNAPVVVTTTTATAQAKCPCGRPEPHIAPYACRSLMGPRYNQ